MSATSLAAQTARDIIEGNRYLVLATADSAGRPWNAPLYFAHLGFTEFFWVSSPDVTHSRNLAVRPEVSIVIFDSQAQIGAGQGVYVSAAAKLLEDGETAEGIEAFSRRSWPTAARSGRARTCAPAPTFGSTEPPLSPTRSLPRTAGPIIASSFRFYGLP